MSDWSSAGDLADLRADAAKHGVTDAMAEAAHRVLGDYFDVSFIAHVDDFVSPSMTGDERTAALAALKAEDARLFEQTRTVVAGAIAAALAQSGATPA